MYALKTKLALSAFAAMVAGEGAYFLSTYEVRTFFIRFLGCKYALAADEPTL